MKFPTCVPVVDALETNPKFLYFNLGNGDFNTSLNLRTSDKICHVLISFTYNPLWFFPFDQKKKIFN